MKRIILIFTLILCLQFNFGQSPEIQLIIESNSERIFLGESVNITVKIIDPYLTSIFNNDKINKLEESNQMINSSGSFSYCFKIEPADTGEIKIGPYNLNYQNQLLQSNEIFIQVKEKNNNNLMFDAPIRMKVNSKGYIKLRSSSIDVSNIDLRDSKFYNIFGRSNSIATNTINGITKKEYIKVFQVTFLKKGVLDLTKDNLINLSEDLEIEPARIIIE